ncbi:amidohydrolase family protein [Bradyrhizobium sp. AUGA SZCCT0042]|uniref:amidohydrolase family protein n=1 Tax=Bradyrhizobium sp. AUGA SZCCT0042 TaxID=2807651 RepID=UPI001BADBC62|nr:amidohydrolase family protein [Bradyrhizobium sp. AUGA SZCCT0042]MBR1297371.1 amidohydrolase [Bradyrhizobium sp. AUGA SZCCT0042]
MAIIALEEHYIDAEVQAALGAPSTPLDEKLADFASARLQDMDRAGITMQVLSHAPPGLQRIDSGNAVALAVRANDRLRQIVANAPTRFAGFASLPTSDPASAADELERAVTKLHFKGAMIHGMIDAVDFMDDRKYWPIFERAQALDVPIYIHPAEPHPDVIRRYFGTYAKTHPMFVRAAWGFTFETGTHAMRLVLSGVFDVYPRLKIILGHFGEAIPFLMARIDEALSRDTPMKNFRDVFSSHFYVTTSGFFSDPALLCCLQEMGTDRILFSVDWPYASNTAGTQWLGGVPLPKEDREKIAFKNAQRLLRI